MSYFFQFFFLLIFASCGISQDEGSHSEIKINGRSSIPIYQVEVPSFWRIQQPPHNESLIDTKLPLCECFIEEDDQKIRITIHNFPTENMEERIPPMAQIARWKQQFKKLDESSVAITPQAFSGFVGFLFEATGIINDEETRMMGWSMQLDAEHYRHLLFAESLKLSKEFGQMRSDFTIKAVGPSRLIQKYRNDIFSFARHFELIKEIPDFS